MEINQKEENGIVFLAFKGRLDGSSATEAEQTVKSILEGENNRLTYISSMHRADAINVLKEWLIKASGEEEWMKHIK